MILDGLLIGAAAMAWTTVLWFYGRAEYREPRWIHLLGTTAVCFACFWIPWVGWLAAAVVQHMALRRLFDLPAPAARIMSLSLLALYLAVRLLFAFAGPPPPPL